MYIKSKISEIYSGEKFGLRGELIRSIIGFAVKNDIEKLYIIGERARGGCDERTGIRLAASGGSVKDFYFDIEEEAPTLLFFKVEDMNENTSDELKNEIDRDGILLYEKV